MKSKKLFLVFVSLIISALVFAGCSQSSSGDSGGSDNSDPTKIDEVTIGVLLPLTGSTAKLGENSRRGIELAAQLINENGGIKSMGGAKIKLEVLDATSDPTKAASAMKQLLSADNKPLAIIGAYASSLTMAASPVSERAKTPLVTTSFSDDLTNKGFKYLFQVAPKASDVGGAQLKYAIEIAKDVGQAIKKVAIVHTNDAYGSSQAKGLKKAAEEEGLEIVMFEAYSQEITDAGPLANKIKSVKPDLLFPVSYLNDGVKIMRALSGSDIPVVGGVGGFITPDFKKALGDDVNGIFSVDTSAPDFYGEIGDRYREEYGTFMPQEAHDNAAALYVIAEALEANATNDPTVLAETLHSEDFDQGAAGSMPGGHVKFDKSGANTVIKPLMVQWQGGELKSVWPQDVAKNEPQWPEN
jgi:branched-chain amino acid transport system substrate-binding protein